MEIGAQLYTVRDYCKDLDSLSETFKKIAEIGYKNIQMSGTCDYDPLWLKEQLDKNDLNCVLTHISRDKLEANPKQVALDHNVFNCKYVGLGYYAFNDDQKFEDFSKIFLPVAKQIKANGKYFMYHNHANEFQKINNRTIFDIISEQIPAQYMGFTLDTYWIQRGGGDPAQYIEKFSGRVPCIHLKDYAFEAKMAVLGEGNINFDRVFQKAESSGTKYLIVEQDDCNGENPFDCLKRSYDYLKSCGF